LLNIYHVRAACRRAVRNGDKACSDHVEQRSMSALDHAGTRFGLAPPQTPVTAIADKLLHVVLYITLLSSFFVIVEPAPYEYLVAVLGFACVLARVSLPRLVLPLLVLLLIRDLGGAIGLLKILDSGWMRLQGDPTVHPETFDYPDSIRFLATSFYLGLSGVMIACIVSQDTIRRLATIRSAYVTAALIASILGLVGYFGFNYKLFSHFDILTVNDRATGGFKGPNDLGSFLIAPLMWLVQGFITDRIRLRNLIACTIIFVALLLTFSRGAWGSSFLGIALLIYFLFVTQKDRRSQNRTILFILAGAAFVIVIFMLLGSFDVVHHMFAERTQLQSYDINADNRSRLNLEEDSFREMFDHPLGMGPWGFAHATNWVSHDVYLGTMLNHGWIGGFAYLTLIALTLIVGFHSIWIRTSWQPFLIATYASFVAMTFEGVWGDTDHWRHFYVLLGLVWGLAAAAKRNSWMANPSIFRDGNNPLSPGLPLSPRNLEASP
jgi:O-antigen ligase/polysaccharide polymerase Wzy-like membrane protein